MESVHRLRLNWRLYYGQIQIRGMYDGSNAFKFPWNIFLKIIYFFCISSEEPAQSRHVHHDNSSHVISISSGSGRNKNTKIGLYGREGQVETL